MNVRVASFIAVVAMVIAIASVGVAIAYDSSVTNDGNESIVTYMIDVIGKNEQQYDDDVYVYTDSAGNISLKKFNGDALQFVREEHRGTNVESMSLKIYIDNSETPLGEVTLTVNGNILVPGEAQEKNLNARQVTKAEFTATDGTSTWKSTFIPKVNDTYITIDEISSDNAVTYYAKEKSENGSFTTYEVLGCNITDITAGLSGDMYTLSGVTCDDYSITTILPTSVCVNGGENTIVKIGNDACINTSITSIRIPDCVTAISSYAFNGCSGMSSFTIPTILTEINDGTFKGTGLTSITIPVNIGSIGNSAFENCTLLQNVTFNTTNLTSIGDSTFKNSGITTISMPNTVTEIGQDCFYNCAELVSMNIPPGVTSLNKGIFCQCAKLQSITIPSTVESIGSEAFNGCTAVEKVTFKKGSKISYIVPDAFGNADAVPYTLRDVNGDMLGILTPSQLRAGASSRDYEFT